MHNKARAFHTYQLHRLNSKLKDIKLKPCPSLATEGKTPEPTNIEDPGTLKKEVILPTHLSRLMSGIPVRKVEKRDIPQLSEVLALAFDNDPAMRWATREDEKRLDALRDLYNYCIEDSLRYGEETTTEDLRACAVWTPPEATEEKPTLTYILRMLPRYLRWTGISKWSRLYKFHERCVEKRSKESHFYLDFIGVHPEKQGQGYASALLCHTLTRLDAQGLPAYLESSNPRNNPLYQRHGFQIIDEIHLPNGPKLWSMWREPVLKTV